MLVAMLSCAAPVSAAWSSTFIPASKRAAEFSAEGAGGYFIQVAGTSRKVTLSASGPTGSASYAVPGRATPGGIRANFGRRGKLEVDFRPGNRRKIETPPNRCEGKPRVMRWGVFVGTIRFKGEHGYTRLRTSRVPGQTNFSPRWRCKRPHSVTTGKFSAAAQKEGGGDIALDISNRKRRLSVTALAFPTPNILGSALFVASMNERRGRMEIARSAIAFATSKKAFVAGDDLKVATLSPPRPFVGKATFRRRRNRSTTWRGSLKIKLPGTSLIPLVGPRCRVRLYRFGNGGRAAKLGG